MHFLSHGTVKILYSASVNIQAESKYLQRACTQETTSKIITEGHVLERWLSGQSYCCTTKRTLIYTPQTQKYEGGVYLAHFVIRTSGSRDKRSLEQVAS